MVNCAAWAAWVSTEVIVWELLKSTAPDAPMALTKLSTTLAEKPLAVPPMAPWIRLLPTSIRLDTMMAAALNFNASMASPSSPVRAVETGLKSSSDSTLIPKICLILASDTPASISVESGEITFAPGGALKTLVTGRPVDLSMVSTVDLETKGPPVALAPTRVKLPSESVTSEGSSAS